MSTESFRQSGVDPQLLRARVRYAAKVDDLTSEMIASLRSLEVTYPDIDVDIVGQDRRGFTVWT